MSALAGLVYASATGVLDQSRDDGRYFLSRLPRGATAGRPAAWSDPQRVGRELRAHHARHHQGYVDPGMAVAQVHPEVGGEGVEGVLRGIVRRAEGHEGHPAQERRDVDEVALAASTSWWPCRPRSRARAAPIPALAPVMTMVLVMVRS